MEGETRKAAPHWRWITLAGASFAVAAALSIVALHPTRLAGSCSTFLMRTEAATLVGHNLDEGFEVPGALVVNPRGVAKHNVSWDDVKAVLGPSRSEPRLRWVSKYGSLTTNGMGREFPDGGVNEAGLYVGEMTLLGTKYPDAKVPRFYTSQWTQYLLDTCATVEDALASVATALPDGHCQWHWFIADRSGRAAVVEFLRGKTVVHTGTTLPYPIAANDGYQAELDDIRKYRGFGGERDPEPRYPREDPRFRWAALMLANRDPATPAVDHAFAILERLDLVGSTRWSVVCDLAAPRLYVRTNRAGSVRWVDLAGLDFSCAAGARLLDIHADLAGDVSGRFARATDVSSAEIVRAFWSAADLGFAGNAMLKPKLIARLTEAPRAFSCAP
ncbi:MAG: linear amide C-N hydrolase [Acidobacteriota bacterium]